MEESQTPPRSKRQKVSVACEPCRARKTKCDGRLPVCGPCQHRGCSSRVCVWDHASARDDVLAQQSEYIRHLESRVRELEQRSYPTIATLPTTRVVDSTRAAPTPDYPLDGGVATASGYRSPDVTTTITAADGNRFLTLVHVSGPPYETPTPAMLGPSMEHRPEHDFCWSSTAASFLHHLYRSTGQNPIEPGKTMDTVALYPKAEYEGTSRFVDYVLPPRRAADGLMDFYWTFIHTLYPFIPRRVTMADYETLWVANGEVPHESSFHCLLNIIFALSSLMMRNGAPDERTQSAAAFYQRAKSLLSYNNTASVRNVQIYLLFSLYLQSTNELHDCWMFAGLAIRTAQSLDLHIAETSERHPNPRVRVLLRRVWHGCVLMDRVLAMISGHPCSIHRTEAAAVDYPTSLEGEIFPTKLSQTSEPRLGEEKISIIDQFNSTLSLYEILYDILCTFYTETRTKPTSLGEAYGKFFGGLEHSIPNIDARLSAWERALPRHLRVQNYPRCSNVTELSRLAFILHQRFLHVRILALRPAFLAIIGLADPATVIDSDMGSMLSHQALVRCSITCFRVAQEAIDLVHTKRTNDPRDITDLSSWWYNVLFLYTAATVVIAARLKVDLLLEICEADISESWEQAIAALQRYSVFSPSVMNMLTTLQVLYGSVALTPNISMAPDKTAQRGMAVNSVYDLGDVVDTGLLLDFSTMPLDPANTMLFDTLDSSWLDTSPFKM